MTIYHIAAAMLRRWYIPLAVLLGATLLTVMMAQDGGIYTTKTVVTFMRPASTSLSPDNGTNELSIIAFAGTVVEVVNNGRPPAAYSMAEAPYFGAGIREGVLVDLANSGNQWASNFDKAEIEIQIVGRTLGWVKARQDEMVNAVTETADAQQAAVSAPPSSRITSSVVPLTTQIDYVAPSRIGQLAAAAAMLAAALIVGAWGAASVDQHLSRRSAVPIDAARSNAPLPKGQTS